MRLSHCVAFAALVSAAPDAPDAAARNIVLTNDDGLTSNIKAAHEALKAAGHDVIVVVPCRDQSGMGAALRHYAAEPGRIAGDCRNGAARAGEPGSGPMTRAGFGRDFHYVDGTPVVALLYGLDVLAPGRWGTPPDLVVSGPNEGRNAGPAIIASGTVSNTQFATNRGLPAVAISAGAGTGDDAALANPASALIARKLTDLVDRLDVRSRGGRMLPKGVALNVNLPDRIEGARWKLAQIGTYSAYDLRFASPGDRSEGVLAGIAIKRTDAEPAADQQEDEAAVSRQDISLSIMQSTFDADTAMRGEMAKRLEDLLAE